MSFSGYRKMAVRAMITKGIYGALHNYNADNSDVVTFLLFLLLPLYHLNLHQMYLGVHSRSI